jgi:acetylornithine deacetylase/succinyl-diaminopimelate desuccinylase-like protein
VAGAKYIALTAHLDTVFPPDTKIDIRRDGARLLGPGISDNGSGLIALLAIAGALQAGNIHHSSPILFVANVGEEGEGDLRGIRYLFSDARWRDAIAGTLVLDGGGTDAIITQGLGSRRFLATVCGPGGHSWSDFGTPNPIALLARAIDLFSRTPIPSQPRTAFNIGVISGGTSVNAIPESASMKVDIRSVSPAELDRLEKALHEALSQVTTDLNGGGIDPRKAHSVSYELKLIGNRPAAELPSNARLLEAIRAVDVQLGIKARLQRASTDANIPLSLGREAIAIGSGGSGGAAHTLREWYDPLNRELGLRRILLTLLVLAGAE